MNKEVFELVKQEQARYLAMDEKQRKEEDKIIEAKWNEVVNRYYELCDNDEVFGELFDKVKELREILSFNIRDCFQVYSHTVNDFDPEASEDIYVYSEEKFQEAKYIHENFKDIEKSIRDKIDRIKNSPLALFKEKRIAKLESELELKRKISVYYAECMEKEKRRLHYLENKATLVDPIVEKYEDVMETYAKQALGEFIEEHPYLVSKKHTSYISSGTKK